MMRIADSERGESPGNPARVHIENAMLAAIVASSDDAIISKTLDGIITSWNGSAERIFGYTAEEAIGKPILMLLPIDRLAEEIEILTKLRAGERIDHLQTVRVDKSGRQIDVELTSSPIKDSTGKIIGASKIVRDISERKRTEMAIQWQQSATEHLTRLNTMGEMASGLACELNQPLASILTYAGVMLEAVRSRSVSTAQITSALTEVVNETNRAAEIVRRLRDFIRKRDPCRESVNVNLLVNDSMHLLEHDLQLAGIKPKMKLAADLPPVEVDPVQLVQVLVNLIRNARDAMIDLDAHGRELTISTSLIENQVAISVIDNGCGVSPEQAGKLFDQFFSTKAAGLGMGLAISKTIVESHGGNLVGANNSDGTGMVFCITLPFVDEKGRYEQSEYSLYCGQRHGRAEGPDLDAGMQRIAG